jgi:1,2-diacylglycerol 3-alpha-glucosyltransferase
MGKQEVSDKPLKICMFTNLFPPVVSGSSTQSAFLARELSTRGHKVCVITTHLSKESMSYEVIDGVEVHRLPALRLPILPIALNFPWLNYTFTPANVRRIKEIIQKFKPDILHLHNHMFDLGFSAALIRRQFRIPLVVTIHTIIKHANKFYNLLLYPLDRVLLKKTVIDNADVIISPDVNIEEYVREAFHRPDSVLVQYGISIIEPPDVEKTILTRKDYGLQGKRVILSLGHIHEIRNRKDLIEALPAILSAVPDTILLMVGAVATDTPRRIAHALNIEHAIAFTGVVAHSEIVNLLSIADIEAHWLNQDVSEKTSLGIASLEAMSAGKAILAAANIDTYGKDVLQPGYNFILVQPGNPQKLAEQIISLLRDDEYRKTLGENARETISVHFSWDVICKRTINVYQQAIVCSQNNF